MKKILIILSLLFVLFSFTPSLFEIYHMKDLPKERTFELVHNYLFDYNFYLSRIKEGQERKWLVVEKYYNQPHQGSLFQIFYLFLGKIGGLFRLSPAFIYHASRLLIGLIFLLMIGKLAMNLFPGWWAIWAYLLIVTAGSWPILVKNGNFWRFATYMGWWSAIDSLQRITFIPHVLLGQIFILVFIWRFSQEFKSPKLLKLLMWGITGFIIGIIFPPTLVVVYTVFAVITSSEFISLMRSNLYGGSTSMAGWFKERVMSRIVFFLLSFPSFIYLQLMFKILPWSALALFDIQHRIPLPYKEYALSQGAVLPLGIAGMVMALIRREKKLIPLISWVGAIGLLFFIFEKVPQQSPLRFTEAAVQIPLGLLTTYLFLILWQLLRKLKLQLKFIGHWAIRLIITSIIIMQFAVMVSMVGWLTDQAYAKRVGSWEVPLGAQLIYPLKDFMDGVYFIRDNTAKNSVILTYITAGNYIPAYAGNYVYIGHANTPDEDGKEKIAAKFFSGKMTKEEARNFLTRERISYIYFGPQEKELGRLPDLTLVYPFLKSIYSNNRVTIYQINII